MVLGQGRAVPAWRLGRGLQAVPLPVTGADAQPESPRGGRVLCVLLDLGLSLPSP